MRSPADGILANRAVGALIRELEAYPKPGLVSPRDSGAHHDMDYALMKQSAEGLLDPFADIACAGRQGGGFESDLVPLGIAAERVMLGITQGVNTHRGAIFSMGLLVAAIARCDALNLPCTPENIRSTLLNTWGEALRCHAGEGKSADSHGGLVHSKTGRGGARLEAAEGFPCLFETGLPVFRQTLAAGFDTNAACIQTLFALMEATDDTNILFRGGMDAASFVRQSAAKFLGDGGCAQPDWHPQAESLHRIFIERNLSPGGSADMLSATLFVSECCGFTLRESASCR